MDSKNIDFSKMTALEIYNCACKLIVSGDVDSGKKGIIFAAEKGCPQAMRRLGQMYEKGNCVEQDEDEAFKWYKLAAANGELEVIQYLTEDKGLNYSEEPLEWCMKVAELGDLSAQIYLAEIYRDGNGVEKDVEESLKWYKMAAEDGNCDAIKNITLVAENGCLEAMLYLAQSYEEGIGVEADDDKAFEWYYLAAKSGNLEAIQWLAAKMVLNYSEEPLELCIKLAENGDSYAQIYLAEMYDGKDFEESLKWYKLAAEGGNRDAIYHLGYMYYRGDEVEQSYEEAYYWFDKDDFRHLPWFVCADMYFYVEKYYKHAFKLYHFALQQGVQEAAYKIGEMYYYGLGTEQDYAKAFEFLKYYDGEFDEDFADEAPPEVQKMLGEMYKNGWGVEQNLEEAEKLFKAAEC